ncbi:hypothetical protein AB6H29_12635 [Providencia hangzhouensis]|uniref:hypothetical protein n=1 Tax=Providencia hangzhouensis TaxID=3031799 RepID=UPI0034DD7ED4
MNRQWIFISENLNEMGMSYHAWILADVLDIINERNREALWQQFVFVMNNNNPAKEAKLFMMLWYAIGKGGFQTTIRQAN